MSDRTWIIAEIGVNHDGDPAVARAMITAAARAGADAVKVQMFQAEALTTARAPKARYQTRQTPAAESQQAMLARLQLTPEDLVALAGHAADEGVAFLASPFDPDSLAFLTGTLRLPWLKLGSGELTDGPLLLAAARSGARLILSTGMATLDEVAEALGVLAFGLGHPGETPPGRSAFLPALATHGALLRERVTLLHCTSAYPTPPEAVNLRALDTLRDRFGVPVGLSDHTEGHAVAVGAVARGARVVEKHFTLDRGRSGPDHAASLDPDQFAALVAALRTVEAALGAPEKTIQPVEQETRMVARKSLVALRPVARGVPLEATVLGVRRPGTGISPLAYWDWLNRPAPRSFDREEEIGS